MYAAGDESPYKSACLSFLEKVRDAEINAVSSAEVLQEILHRYRSIDRLTDGMRVYDSIRSLPVRWMEILPEDVDHAKNLLLSLRNISSRDALHIAVMHRAGIRKIVTYDQGFLGIESITVHRPESLA